MLHALPLSGLEGKRILIRSDFDVEVKNGKIIDDFRIRKALPTIQDCLTRGGEVRVIAHIGRPHGKRDIKLTLQPIARHLERLLKRPVLFIPDPFDRSVRERSDGSKQIMLFENIRFWKEEETDSSAFAARLARWGDIYVNEAFADSHRNHASVVALARRLPSYMGHSLQSEIQYLGLVRNHPKYPFVAILGGAKLETKMPLLHHFLKTADTVIIGGVLANTIYALQGKEIGKSKSDTKDGLGVSTFLRNKKLAIPDDVVVVKNLRGSARQTVKTPDRVDSSDYIVDVGNTSIKHFSALLKNAAMIVWNGPFGYTEVPEFAKGTKKLARAVARTHALTVIGGGDVIAAVGARNLLRTFTHVSTGGGAMLSFLAGEKLPGLEALKW